MTITKYGLCLINFCANMIIIFSKIGIAYQVLGFIVSYTCLFFDLETDNKLRSV